MFNLFTPPCFAAIGAMNAELKSAKWLWGAIGIQLGVGFTVSYFVYTVGTLIVEPSALKLLPTVLGFIAVLLFATVLVCLSIRASKRLKVEQLKKAQIPVK